MVVPFLIVFGLFSGSARAEVGVTDNEVVVGAHTAESGAFAVYAALPRAIQAVFDRTNEQGGVNGRKIKFIREDTQWNYQKAAIGTRKLIESDKIFAMVGAQGDSHIAAYKELSSRGVPDLFFVDGASGYEPFPKGTFGYHQSNKTDGRAYGEYAVKHFKGKRVCFLSAETLAADIPKEARATIEAANRKLPEAQKIKIGATETVEKMAPQADTEVERLKADKCDAVIMTVMMPLSANIINSASSQNFKPTWIIFWWNVVAKFTTLLNDPNNLDIVSAVAIARDDSAGIKGWKDYEATMEKYHVPISGLTASGYHVGELFVEALKRAGRDLTREKIVKAVESMHGYMCSLCLTPVEYSPKQHWAFTKLITIKLQDGKWHKWKEQ